MYDDLHDLLDPAEPPRVAQALHVIARNVPARPAPRVARRHRRRLRAAVASSALGLGRRLSIATGIAGALTIVVSASLATPPATEFEGASVPAGEHATSAKNPDLARTGQMDLPGLPDGVHAPDAASGTQRATPPTAGQHRADGAASPAGHAADPAPPRGRDEARPAGPPETPPRATPQPPGREGLPRATPTPGGPRAESSPARARSAQADWPPPPPRGKQR